MKPPQPRDNHYKTPPVHFKRNFVTSQRKSKSNISRFFFLNWTNVKLLNKLLKQQIRLITQSQKPATHQIFICTIICFSLKNTKKKILTLHTTHVARQDSTLTRFFAFGISNVHVFPGRPQNVNFYRLLNWKLLSLEQSKKCLLTMPFKMLAILIKSIN